MLERIDVKTLDQNVCSLIGDQWMLITAGTPERCNTMTASWGGLGVLWGTNVATCYIRPQRYTREFVEREAYFTLAFFGEEHRKALALCGARPERETRPISRRPSWCWSAASCTGRTWTPPTSWTPGLMASGIRTRIITGSISARLWSV